MNKLLLLSLLLSLLLKHSMTEKPVLSTLLSSFVCHLMYLSFPDMWSGFNSFCALFNACTSIPTKGWRTAGPGAWRGCNGYWGWTGSWCLLGTPGVRLILLPASSCLQKFWRKYDIDYNRLTSLSLIDRKRTENLRDQRLWKYPPADYNDHVKESESLIIKASVRVISSR